MIASTPSQSGLEGTRSDKPTTFRKVFRAVRWITYAAAMVTLAMLFHSVPPPVIATSAEASDRVDHKLEEVEQALAAGQPGALRLDQTELNSYLASHLDIAPSQSTAPKASKNTSTPDDSGALGTPAPGRTSAEQAERAHSSVRDVKVELVGDRARAYVIFDFHGKEMSLQLEGRLGAVNGYLRFQPVSGQIGSLPIPQSTLQTAVQKMMESPENRETLRLPAEIRDLRVEDGELVVTFR